MEKRKILKNISKRIDESYIYQKIKKISNTIFERFLMFLVLVIGIPLALLLAPLFVLIIVFYSIIIDLIQNKT